MIGGHVILSSDWLMQGVQGGHVSGVVALGRVVPLQRHVRPRHAGQGAQLRARGALPGRHLPRGQRGGGVSTISTQLSTRSTRLSTLSTAGGQLRWRHVLRLGGVAALVQLLRLLRYRAEITTAAVRGAYQGPGEL